MRLGKRKEMEEKLIVNENPNVLHFCNYQNKTVR